jgi:catechol 2,3-dioxygenase-like lactoylglutathione lyase family enzyme
MLAQARVEATVPTTRLDTAREFYEGTLGLPAAGPEGPGPAMLFECGGETRLLVYERPSTGVPSHTLAHFQVDDVEAEVAELRGRGVKFEEYDMPGLKTVDGVATVDDFKAAWFKDPDGNIIGIHN